MEKISIIVPVYNVEAYIGECIDSLIAQTYKSIEIILVDDGSSDTSGKICDDYAKSDSRITVIHSPNGGVSRARNIGLDNASGEWITFVDSDDWLDKDFCQKLVEKAENADIVFARMIRNFSDGQTSEFFETTLEKVAQAPYNLEYIIHDRIHSEIDGKFVTDCIHGSVCRSLLKLSIINDNELRFMVGVKALEDRLFIMKYLSLCKSGALVDEYLYHYRCVTSSATQKPVYRKELFEERKFLLEKELEIIMSNENLSVKERKQLAKAQTSKLWWSVASHEAYFNPNYKKQLSLYRKKGGVKNPLSIGFLFYLKKKKYSIKRVAMFALIKLKMWGLFKKLLHKA